METMIERMEREQGEQVLVDLWHKARKKGLVPPSIEEQEKQDADEARHYQWYIDQFCKENCNDT